MAPLGVKLSEEHKKKLSESHKGPRPWRVGKKLPYRPHLTMRKPWSDARRKAQELRKHVSYVHKTLRKPVIKNGKEYHHLWHEIRKLIYKRDLWRCQECGLHCHNDRKIQCHHIDYDTTNNDLSNLITLCASCHMKTNFRRADWIIHYRKEIK